MTVPAVSAQFGKLRNTAERTITKKDWINWFLLTAFFSCQLFLLLHHEAWRDEAQAWMIGRNYSVTEILKDLQNEGHPALWFLCIKIVTFFGLPYR